MIRFLKVHGGVYVGAPGLLEEFDSQVVELTTPQTLCSDLVWGVGVVLCRRVNLPLLHWRAPKSPGRGYSVRCVA